MYPDLSYLFHDLLGTAPDNWLSIFKTFGFFLAIAFLVSAVVFRLELKRKALQGVYQPTRVTIQEGAPPSGADIISNAVMGLLLGGKGWYAYQNFADFRTDPASVILSTKMAWPAAILGALILGGWTWWDAYRKRGAQTREKNVSIYPHDRISELTVAAAIGGILGAKLFDVIDNWDSFVQDPIGALTSGGGLAIYGGLVLGFVAVVGYMRRVGIPFWPTADAVAPALAAGYGTGRVGCQLSGDGDWGIVNNAPSPGWLPDWLWASHYPHNVLKEGDPIPGCTWEYCMQLTDPVYPTPLYEVLMMTVVFGILWLLRKRLKTVGLLFFVYIALISVERLLIEQIRVNIEHNWLGMQLTQAELISAILLLVAIGGMVFVSRKRPAGEYV